jgi:drug/metabolite transporter (DMT)-like permease
MDWFWIAFVSAILSAVAAVMQKKALQDLDPLRFSVLVSAFTTVLSVPFLSAVDPGCIENLSLLVLFGKSLLNAAAFFCIMTALKHLDISRALPVMAISPMIIAILAFILLGESLSTLEFAGVILISAGTYSLELKKSESYLHPFRVLTGSKYHKYLLAALALISVSSVIDKVLLSKFKLPPVTFLVFQNLFFFIIFTAIFIVTRRSELSSLFSNRRDTVVLLILIASATVLYRWTQFEATKIAPVGLVISVKRLSVLFASVAGSRIFKEEDFVRRIIATVLIVGGAMLIMRD